MNLSQIRTDFLAILNRNDCTTDLANTFITKAQTRIERTLRVPGMEKMSITTGNVSPVTDQIVIPTDFLSMKFLISGDILMSNLDLSRFLNYRANRPGSDPQWYTRIGASFLVHPTVPADKEVTLVYYGSQTPLVADEDTNFFSIAADDLLLYGALSYACDYFVDDRTASFEARFTQLYSDLETQGQMTDMDQSAQAIAPAYNTEY